MKTILITGHMGLVGRHLWPILEKEGYRLKGIDINSNVPEFLGDISNEENLRNSILECDGIIHLAAVSRVIWGEQNPEFCRLINARSSENLINLAVQSPRKPWVIVASSREVYGEPECLPVAENTPVNPVNVYGYSKVAMEKATLAARELGIRTAIVRLANVYGCTEDHVDRVLPAFCRSAVLGKPLRVDGRNNTFDFTHISDTAEGLRLVVEQIVNGATLPPLHLLPGVGTTLWEAAEMAVEAADSVSIIYESPQRTYDVCRFIGNPTETKKILSWEPKILPNDGICDFVNKFRVKFSAQMEIA